MVVRLLWFWLLLLLLEKIDTLDDDDDEPIVECSPLSSWQIIFVANELSILANKNRNDNDNEINDRFITVLLNILEQ